MKVMQLLYAKNQDSEVTLSTILKQYEEAIDKAFELYLFTLYIFLETTRVAVSAAEKKQSKLLPSEEDHKFTDILYSNDLVQSLFTNKLLENKFNKLRFAFILDEDIPSRLYRDFAKTDVYKEYLKSQGSDEDHRAILLDLFRSLRKDEHFNEIIDDHFPNWYDDKSLAIGAIKKTIKLLPNVKENFFEEFTPDAETAEEFGRQLLKETGQNDAELLALIQPTLKNWDLDRLAVIDVILIKMALGEFLYFPTIPTKVTLNEYVDISKQYSTPKSKDFINGILDKLMKTLVEDGQIKKEGRGLIE